MVRPLRIQYGGAWYHVMNRVLECRNIFLSDKYKKTFLNLLSEISERFLGISGDGFSKRYKRFLGKLKLDNDMRERVELVKKEIYG